MNHVLRSRRIRDAQILRVPFQRCAAAIRNDAQQNGFGERAGLVEVAGRAAAGFDGFDPFVVVADGLRPAVVHCWAPRLANGDGFDNLTQWEKGRQNSQRLYPPGLNRQSIWFEGIV